MKKKSIIIDCDPGCDDTIALLLAFGNEVLDIKGVTVSAGNVHINNTTENTRKLVGAFKPEIKIAKGCEKPLFKEIVTAPEVHGESGIGCVVLPENHKKIEELNAVEFLAKTLKESDEKIDIVITGPMTNLAVFLMTYPELKCKINKFIIMGGSSIGGNVTPSAEFNIYVDPEAADIIFKSGIDIVLCPLDVTMKAYVTEKELEEIKSIGGLAAEVAHGAIKTALDFYKEFYNRNEVPMHDPCTIAYLLKPEIFAGEKVFLGVELKGELTYGETIIDYRDKFGKEKNAFVLNEINREQFIELLKAAIKTIS
ncbi:nucleoside hydrolase [Candidatus Cetobacterium colombiensis]|jgi:pyrimidine-specific ribonucleoside hydrolase|uniref:Nucleoside hydrolase n=1 Tax=Candidatus Cetobacterium colombiensis TaxID=3073100 RepID=A0ABU4W6L7_9FUSO|nr:nucleoside hydrolase [Candidatus Cetobacterium colombiensis]MDX8335175.1 nucleoside hydrolase [Candidatus Cetobacterium colombiensis]